MSPSGCCRFCDIVSGKYRYKGIDEPFATSDEFVSIVSIGALVEGWTLIVPKYHQLSMRNVYKNSAFFDFVNTLLPHLVHQYGPVIVFEHGANKEGSITACGTDHAHLHLVPFGESLLSDLQYSGLHWLRCQASEIASRALGQEYLFYAELNSKENWQDPVGYLHILEFPLSQFFRRLIARRVGDVCESDYKHFPFLDTARHTRTVLIEKVA